MSMQTNGFGMNKSSFATNSIGFGMNRSNFGANHSKSLIERNVNALSQKSLCIETHPIIDPMNPPIRDNGTRIPPPYACGVGMPIPFHVPEVHIHPHFPDTRPDSKLV